LAYGRLGWDEDKFLDASPSYFFKALKGFNDLENQREREHWERLRILGNWIVLPYAKKGSNLTPRKLLPLPWDNEVSWKESNKEILDRCDEIIRKTNGK
jgi:hypothetical protein